MSTLLHDAVVQHLLALGVRSGDGAVRRLTMDIEVDGRLEMVTLGLRDGTLQCVSSDGEAEGPHVLAALQFIAGLEKREESSPPEPIASMPARSAEASASADLAEALEDLLTAVARVGVNKAQYAPSVDAAFERVVAIAPQARPSGLGRFVGRLQQEIHSGEIRRVARMLEGASQLVEALRSRPRSPDEDERLSAWLGAGLGAAPKVEGLYDRTMIELGREWVSGTERASIERRYLIDLESGNTYCEDRPKQASASLGPCPRQLQIGMAEVEMGASPRRIRILQYEVHPDVPIESWKRLRDVASQSFAEVTERYRRSVHALPALSEPFALIAPYRIECNGVFKAFDAGGSQLVLDRSERRGAVLAFYELLAGGVEPAWLAGRLTDIGATLCLTPFALGTRDGTYTRL